MTAFIKRLRTFIDSRLSALAVWSRERPAMAVALLGIGACVVLFGLGFLVFGGITGKALRAYQAIQDSKETVEAYGKLVSALGLLLAAPFGVMGFGLAMWRTWNQHRDSLTAARKLDAEAYAKAAEAFAKAVEQLGHAEIAIRIGAVLALEALGKSTPRLLSQVIEILCAYIREKRPLPPRTPKGDSPPLVGLGTDIQLMLYVISRLRVCDPKHRIRVGLQNTDLRQADLRGAKLCQTDLSGANLSGARLWHADLGRANLYEADLSGADLRGTHLNGANLCKANLRETDLRGTDLVRVNLDRAILTGTILDPARKAADGDRAEAG